MLLLYWLVLQPEKPPFASVVELDEPLRMYQKPLAAFALPVAAPVPLLVRSANQVDRPAILQPCPPQRLAGLAGRPPDLHAFRYRPSAAKDYALVQPA